MAQSEAKALVNAGHKAIGLRCDVSDDAQVEQVLWLCSPAASYVVGQALTVDGGMTVV